jgi:cytoskeleton protein RodZ
MTQASGPPELLSADLVTGAGARLRQAREARQMDIAQVANELRLSARNIEALEAENLGQLPEPSYVCGYLRSYAKLMGLPPDEILDHFPGVRDYLASVKSTVMPTRMVVPSEHASRQAPLPGFTPANVGMVLAAAVVAILLITQLLRDGEGEPATQQQTASSEATSQQPVAAAAGESAPTVAPPQAEPPAAEKAVESAAQDHTEVAQAAPQPVVPASPAVAPASPATGPATSQLVLEFRGESWIEVHDATDRRLAYELAPAGVTRTLSGVAPFRVVLGAGSEVDIRYNDVVYDMRRYRRAKMVNLAIGSAEDNRTRNSVN